MDKVDLQKETKEEVKEEVKEEKVEEEKIPEGFYVGEIVTQKASVVVFEGEAVDEKELLVKMANLLKKQMGFKL